MGTHTTLDQFITTGHWTGASEEIVMAAATSNQPRIVVSGRLAGGKDTVAEAVMARLGCHDAVRVSFATALRREVDELIDAVRLHGPENARAVVAETSGVATARVARSADLICAALAADPTVHSYLRTKEIRLLLQEWGTDVRRAGDDEYWVKQAMREVVTHLAANRPVYVTDARFVNEVEAAKQLGFLAVRLEVALPIRAARLKARDGLDIDPLAENHPSEQQLENYQEFDLWVDNSGPLDHAVSAVRDAVLARSIRTNV